MKTQEQLNVLKEEVETLNNKLAELTEEELKQVTGGGEEVPYGYPTKPRPDWACEDKYKWCPNCQEWVGTTAGPVISGAGQRICDICGALVPSTN